MAKRFTSTDIWDEDWFLDIPIDYRLFWFFIKDKCDQAGFFKVNVTTFNSTNKTKINADKAFEFFNTGKERLRKINGSIWLLEDFFKFQYGHKFNELNKVHAGIEKLYKMNGVSIASLKGIDRVSIAPTKT